jgi:CHAT domain-containing protein
LFISDNLFIWVIKLTGEIIFRQIDLKPLQQQNASLSGLVVQAREFLGVEAHTREATANISSEIPQPIRHISPPLRQLHQYLIEPIADLLSTDPNATDHLHPARTLFLVPFPALQDTTANF